jgi:hypothetical protein
MMDSIRSGSLWTIAAGVPWEDWLVYATVWLAVGCWFVGAMSRILADRWSFRRGDVGGRHWALERAYRSCWLLGGILTLVHIAASYGWVHRWSHAAALQATAEESYRVTGIRASWGVYVNFVFAFVWLSYAITMWVRAGRFNVLDALIFWFSALIVFAATVLFESGVLRWLSLAGFVALAFTHAVTVRGRRDER